jgi:hypothetical protein
MHHAVPRQLPPLETVLPEMQERRCPQCMGDGIALAGHVIAAAGMIKVEYRCTACRIAFMYVRAALDWAPLSLAAALDPPQEARLV